MEAIFKETGYQYAPFHILVVDDNGQQLDLVSRILSSPKYSLFLRRNGMEALQEFCADPASLVITDFHMPIMNGVDLTLHIKSLS